MTGPSPGPVSGPLVVAVEAGGTKCIAAVGRAEGELARSEKLVVPTGEPEATVTALFEWCESRLAGAPAAAVGVAAFGPLDLRRGRVAATPKPGWSGFDWRAAVAARWPRAAAAVDTDTSAAALAEHRWGAAEGTGTSAYVTVGTGIGAGVVVAGAPLHGLVHPEIGHMRVPRAPGDDYAGRCPFHGDCLEGLASGPAIGERWGVDPRDLPAGHPAWELEAGYLAAGVANLVAVVSPERVVMGGGVTAGPGLLAMVRRRTRELLGGYIAGLEDDEALESYLVPPGLGTDSGLLGAFLLGLGALSGGTAPDGPGSGGVGQSEAESQQRHVGDR